MLVTKWVVMMNLFYPTLAPIPINKTPHFKNEDACIVYLRTIHEYTRNAFQLQCMTMQVEEDSIFEFEPPGPRAPSTPSQDRG